MYIPFENYIYIYMVMVKVIWKLCEAYNVEMCGKIENCYWTWFRELCHLNKKYIPQMRE